MAFVLAYFIIRLIRVHVFIRGFRFVEKREGKLIVYDA
jgi:hypothetical protein